MIVTSQFDEAGMIFEDALRTTKKCVDFHFHFLLYPGLEKDGIPHHGSKDAALL
jgi:hypothetical protein